MAPYGRGNGSAGRAAAAGLAIALCCAATGAWAEPAATRFKTGAAVSCLFEGWSNDADPAGLPVRVEPQNDAVQTTRLPPPRLIGPDEVAVLVRVTGYRDGWFQIDSAWFPGESRPGGGRASAEVFKGQGWVPAGTIKATLASPALRLAPRADAPLRASLTGTRGGFPITPDGIAVKRLLSCNGKWVEADTEFGRGWVDRVCARQLSACN
jgi:hypothetical protein